MDGLGGSVAPRVCTPHDGEAPAGVLASVKDHSLGILKVTWKLLPVHPEEENNLIKVVVVVVTSKRPRNV